MTVSVRQRARLGAPIALFLLLASIGCAFVGPPVTVAGMPRDIAMIEGEWWGDYTGNLDHGRHGTISFRLKADERQARGSVLMKADDQLFPYQPFAGDPNMRQRPNPDLETTLLSIRFVFVSDGEVEGELDPYWDPDRRVQVLTTFRGSIDGRVINGTFRTRYANGATPAQGSWKVTRRQ